VLNGCVCYSELLGAVFVGISRVLVMNLMQTVDVCACHFAILFMQTHFVTGSTCRTCSRVIFVCSHGIEFHRVQFVLLAVSILLCYDVMLSREQQSVTESKAVLEQ